MAATDAPKQKDMELGDGELGKGESATEPTSRKQMQFWLIAVALTMTVVPGGIFMVMSITDGNNCSNDLDACNSRCEDSYAVAVVRFQSEAKSKIVCLDECQEKHGVVCVRKSFAGLVFSILLVSGMAFTFVLNIVIPSISGEQDDADAFFSKARSAYIEPSASEEEIRAREKEKYRFFWQDVYKTPTLVEYACQNCAYINQMDEKWWKVKKGGLTPAICKRCRNVLAGVR